MSKTHDELVAEMMAGYGAIQTTVRADLERLQAEHAGDRAAYKRAANAYSRSRLRSRS